MKILSLNLIVFLGVFLNINLNAQSLKEMKAMSVEESATMKTNELKKELHLSESQVEKVQVINEEFAKKALPIIKSNDSKFTILSNLKPFDKKRDQDLEKVFDEKQFELYKKNKKKKILKLKSEFLSED